jgi:peptidoglycan/xylan/chitin deacetylase (PgdA/CDA1 family)
MTVNALALMYHDVTQPGQEDSSGFPGGDAARYKLDTKQFDEHLRAFRACIGHRPMLIDDHAAAAVGRSSRRSFFLTFDDGGASAEAIGERLEAFGWRGHFFVTASFVNRPSFLTSGQVRRLRERGHVIGTHSWSHPLRMARWPASRLREEWVRSVDVLSNILGEGVRTGSVPGGSFSRAVADTAADAGIRVLFTSRPTVHVHASETLAVIGRYAVRRSTPAEVAARVATGARWPRLSQLVLWDASTVLKRLAGPAYLEARGWVLGSSASARWGDDVPQREPSEDPS